MRKIEVIEADIENVKKLARPDHDYHRAFEVLDEELRAAHTDGIPLDRLEAICAAEKAGKLVVLPCKVGDTVWSQQQIGMFGTPLMPYRIEAVCMRAFGDFGDATCEFSFDMDDVGKDIFPTREAAEEAMKEKQ